MNKNTNACYPSQPTYPTWPWTERLGSTKLIFDKDEVARLLGNSLPANHYVEYSKDKDQALVLVKLPGFKKEDIKAEVFNNHICITAKSNSDFVGKSIEQKVFLHGTHKEWECLTAKLDSGILSLELKTTRSKQSININ